MTGCANCGRQARERTARVHLTADGTECRVLCQRCQTTAPRDNLYAPTTLPVRSVTDITSRGVTD